MHRTISSHVAEFLKSRRIPIEVAERAGVVAWSGKLAFEYRRKSGLQYRKIRSVDKTGEKSFHRDRKGGETCLFMEHLIETEADLSCPLVVTEGEIDAISVAACDIRNVVSVPDGAQLDAAGQGHVDPDHDTAFGWMWSNKDLKPHLKVFDRVVLAVDSDRKGEILREELAVRFGTHRCYFVEYPEGCKDCNEVLVQFGEETLRAIIQNAKPLVPDRLVRFGDLVDISVNRTYTSGFEGLDDELGLSFMAPSLVVITGEPGSGKSEWTTILGAQLAHLHQLPGAFLQFEDRSARIRDALVRYAKGNVLGVETQIEALGWVNRWFRTIEPDQVREKDDDYTIAWLEQSIREARTRHGCKWVVIDPWNELEHMWDRRQSEAIYINDALRRLKRIARTYQIILLVVTHPSKEGGRMRNIEDLDLYTIAGGAAWANKADHGIILHRPDKSQAEVFVKIAKSKDHSCMGRPGIVKMQYRPASAKFVSIARDHETY